MSNDSIRDRIRKKRKEREKKVSIATRINVSLLAVLIPSLAVLIVTACIIAAQAISGLNDKFLLSQADSAVSRIDDFFSSKVSAISMFEENANMQQYFQAVSKSEEISEYEDIDIVLGELSGAQERMAGEQVQQAWLADTRTNSCLMSDGKVVTEDIENTVWYQQAAPSRQAVISDPYTDAATGKQVVSVVSPVFAQNDENILGFVGFDVFVDSLEELLSGIEVGEEGYIEVLSNKWDYIYSGDPLAMGLNVDELKIGKDYKDKVKNDYNGLADFEYEKEKYTAVFQNCQTTGWLAIATIPMAEVNATRNELIKVLIFLSAIILAILISVIVIIIRKRMKPMTEISGKMADFARGSLEVDVRTKSYDEIGRMAESIRSSVYSLKIIIEDINHILGEISRGNLDISVEDIYIGDFRFIREALERIISSLNTMLGQIDRAAQQVSLGSEQVSQGAQSMAHGAQQQAEAVEYLAVSSTEIFQQITANANNAAEANHKADRVKEAVEKSSLRMQEMLTAMEAIRNSSREIEKIINTIEDIAFQTNILALNASIEAARAGESGKGFNVVAAEVRNLAARSAKESKNTAALIENSLSAVENGTRIADETAKTLQNVVIGVKEVVETINGISESSARQAHSVRQVEQGIEQISDVVQANSATAQESAAASEELSAQAQLLKELIEKFQIKRND